jgi:hypothetical protein
MTAPDPTPSQDPAGANTVAGSLSNVDVWIVNALRILARKEDAGVKLTPAELVVITLLRGAKELESTARAILNDEEGLADD